MTLVPQSCQEQLARQLTELSLARCAAPLGFEQDCLEYAYVMHYRLSTNPVSPGLLDPHTHVVLPGTWFNERYSKRVGLYFSRRRRDIDMLHDVTEQTMVELLARYASPDWE